LDFWGRLNHRWSNQIESDSVRDIFLGIVDWHVDYEMTTKPKWTFVEDRNKLIHKSMM
jgi:hypothetical protein